MTGSKFETELQRISLLREQKGREIDTLNAIKSLKPRVEDDQDFSSLALLYFEEAFTYQHLFMSHIETDTNLKLMEEAALEAHHIITTNQLSTLLPDSHRMLGRVKDYQKNYLAAYDHYQWALDAYQKDNHPRVFEIKSFISTNLVNQGRHQDGLDLAKKTYRDFDTLPLKQTDYYTWAVWKTGIFPRISNALLSQGTDFNRQEIKEYLNDSLNLLLSSGNPSDFQYRIDELKEALEKLD